MPLHLVDFFTGEGVPDSFADFLSALPYDQLIEVDFNEQRTVCLNEVEGKYFGVDQTIEQDAMLEYTIAEMIHPDDIDVFTRLTDPATMHERLSAAQLPGVVSADFRYKLQDGSWRWVEQYVVGDGFFGFPRGLVHTYVFDIESLYTRKQGIRSTSNFTLGTDFDVRTGLIREGSFIRRIDSVIAGNPSEQWCVLVADIDHFELFNVWYGREAGDVLLSEIGARFAKEAERTGGLAGYLGRDGFSLMIPYDRAAIEKLFDDMHAIVLRHGDAAGFMPAFGICIIDGSVSSYDLVDQALIAASNAKTDFRKNICVFNPAMRENAEKEYRILVDFLHGIESGEIFFQLQPQCRMSTGKVVGAEALARWRKADGTMVSPVDFVPVLERNGFISTLDCCIWEKVCAWLRDWIAAGHTPIPVSVNVSQVDFYALDVPDYFEKLINRYDLDPKLVKVEVTESAYVDNVVVISEAIEELRELGFTLIMDDFGSGYSSLNTLRNLDIDVIKLDARFLWKGEDAKHKGVHILESVINMAKSLGLPIICEGVETDDQTSFLQSQGCRYVQGFKFFRPMDVAAFEKIIADAESVDMSGLVPKHNEQFRTRELFDENVYSDAMLNNILGAAALYSWHGDDVDIIRFNEQFYKVMNHPSFESFMYGVQDIMPASEVPKLYGLLREAEEHEVNGSSGALEFLRDDGTTNRFHYTFYYLGQKGDSKQFYASVKDITEISAIQEQMKLISDYASGTIVFVRNSPEGLRFSVAVHGLEDALGISAAVLEQELNSGLIVNRFDELATETFNMFLQGYRFEKQYIRFDVKRTTGEAIHIVAKVDMVNDPMSDVECLLDLHVE